MISPDPGITMALGAAIGTVVGIYYGNISMSMSIGAGAGAILGGMFMLKNKLTNSNKDEQQ